jgi:hypothetical protein
MISTILRGLALAVLVAVWSLLGCTPSDDASQREVLGLVEAADDSAVIGLSTSVNGFNADTPPGPSFDIGQELMLSYIVKNNDVAPLTGVVVTDDVFGPVTCPKTELEAGYSMTCLIERTPTAGPYSTVGRVTATRTDGNAVEAFDPTNFRVTPYCEAGGPYAAECPGDIATIPLSGSVVDPPAGTTLAYAWTTNCPGGTFDDSTILTPVVTLDATGGCLTACKVTLILSDLTAVLSTSEADVTVSDTTAPTFTTAPADLSFGCGELDPLAVETWLASAAAADACGDVIVTHDLAEMPGTCGVSITVTWTATDECDNAATTSATLSVAANAPPVFTTTPADLALECGDPGNDDAVQAWLASAVATGGCGNVTLDNDFVGMPDNCGGSVTVTWTATDECGLTAEVSASLTVADTIAPVITLNGDETVTVECHIGTYTELGASVFDQCDTALTEAIVGGDVVDVNTPGTYVMTYNAVDTCGNPAVQVIRTVEVVDTTSPVITAKEAAEIWPPNHKYAEYKLSDLVTVEDACDGSLDIDAMGAIVSIYSDEPEDVKGNGDGNTKDDIVIVGPGSFKVRAERQGAGNGRVYGISFVLADPAGNATTATAFVSVPHDQSGKAAVDDGPGAGYTVTP